MHRPVDGSGIMMNQWSSWGQGWGNSQWSWNSATSWWSSGDWGSRPEDADEAKGTEAARVQALLKRGHTVDQLSTEDLQLLVRERETKQKKAAAPEAEASSVVQGETKVQAGDDKKEEEQEQEDKKGIKRREAEAPSCTKHEILSQPGELPDCK